MKNDQIDSNTPDPAWLALARTGDQHAFEELVAPYRNELLVHSYRFLGSFDDAENALKETLLRAWHRLDTFEGQSSLRAWLYKISTIASLDALDSRNRRAMSRELYTQGNPNIPLPPPANQPAWVEPFPDSLIDQQPAIYPDARYEIRESITLAFVAALQHLPGRQRAILLLRDVLGWNINGITDILSMTPALVNSTLQRARVTIQQYWNRREQLRAILIDDDLKASLLNRYVTAWETADASTLVTLLREDAILTMPPFPVWFGGHQDIQTFLETNIFKTLADAPLRLVATRANGSPAFAVYQLTPTGSYQPSALHVLSLEQGQIREINDFLTSDEKLFTRFGLPALG